MGRKDDYQFDYLDDDTRFADQINGALFKGIQVVKPEELEPEDSQIVSTGSIDGVTWQEGKSSNRKNRKQREGSCSIRTVVDKARLWKGRKLHILVVENQNYVDYQMVLRNMLSESVGYRKQWKQKKRLHTAAGDLKDKDEYLSGMKKDEKFAPIITLVVYFGDEHKWNGARCLYDLLDIDDELKEYVTNYKLNLYDCQEHDTFNEYRTGLRQVFEAVRYSKDKEGLKKVMEENKEAYSNIDSETKDMLEVVANIRIPENFKKEENGEERYNMCKAFEDMRLEGYEEGITTGRTEGIRILIQAYQELGLSKDTIIQKCAEKFGIELESAGRYAEEYCV
ncbi:MAG: Rpn family recombination-promoting nuclease/putative transposase [Clostridiales bacterium]|nr:Rpn family recombination-promoting nuclease/putative transposase [Clostridiales bacterium]